MRRLNLYLVLLALLAAGCGTAGGDTPDGDPVVAGVCAEDAPDCEDTLVGDGGAAGTCPVGTPDCNDTPGLGDGPGEPGSGLVVDGGLTVSEALVTDAIGPLAVQGFLLVESDGVRLCEALAESFPPQCGGASVTVENLAALDEYTSAIEGDVRWSESTVLLFGDIVDGVFVVDAGMTG